MEIHNTLRCDKHGGATYERILHASKLLNQYGVPFNILTVVTAELAQNVRRVYREYKKRGWRYQQYIACLDPLEEPHGQLSFSLTPKAYGAFLIELFQLWYADIKSGSQPCIRQFDNYVGLAAGILAEACDQRGTCGIQYVVEADGSVYPCDFYMLDEYRLGNFNQDRLEQIDAAREKIGFVKRSEMLETKCLNCRYYRLCRGGCQRHRDYNTDTGQYTNYFCEGYQVFFDACYEKIMKLGKML